MYMNGTNVAQQCMQQHVLFTLILSLISDRDTLQLHNIRANCTRNAIVTTIYCLDFFVIVQVRLFICSDYRLPVVGK